MTATPKIKTLRFMEPDDSPVVVPAELTNSVSPQQLVQSLQHPIDRLVCVGGFISVSFAQCHLLILFKQKKK